MSGKASEGASAPTRREWLHDLEHEDAALAGAMERVRFGNVSAREKAEIRLWKRALDADVRMSRQANCKVA